MVKSMLAFGPSVNERECPHAYITFVDGQKAEEMFHIELLCAKKNPLESIGNLLELCDIV
jgi:hypothetical protein